MPIPLSLFVELPFNDYLEYFAPEYKLKIQPTNMDNLNTREYLEKYCAKIIDNLRNVAHAPSVQMQDVPADFLKDSSDEDEEPETRITRK